MTHEDIQVKFLSIKSELVNEITNYVIENAKFKIGDLINITCFDNYTYVVDQVGYSQHGIEYFGKRVKKDGEIANITMFSGIGVAERAVSKATLLVNKQVSNLDKPKSVKRPIDFIDPTTFRNDPTIKIKLSL